MISALVTFVFLGYFCIKKSVCGLDHSPWDLELDCQVLNVGFMSKSNNHSVPQFPYQQIGVGVRINSLIHIKYFEQYLTLIQLSSNTSSYKHEL